MLTRGTERHRIAQETLKEATRVRQAYDSVVVRHRAAWRAASPDQAPKAERKLRLALDQLEAAKANEDLARAELYG